MSGHSKWHNIRVKKEKMDARRGKVFTKISKEIMLAVRESGPDPDANYRLATVISKAKDVNMPNSNIQRAIDRASGALEGDNLEEAVYEGYGPHGVAILIEAVTDNRNRTVPEIRNIFSKAGGSMGEAGCVAWQFDKKGVITVKTDAVTADELLDLALEAGAEDLSREEGLFQITTDPSSYMDVKRALEAKKVPMESSDLTMIPRDEITLDKKQATQIMELMEALEDHDDIQNVYANFDIPDNIMKELEDEN